MKTLFLLRGLPGSGKTTAAQILSDGKRKYPVFSADDFFMVDGEYKWNAEFIGKAHQWCRAVTEIAMNNPSISVDGDYMIFVANTFTQEWEMEEYFLLARKYGYQVITMVIENRHGSKNIHNVPDDKIEQMRNRFQVKL